MLIHLTGPDGQYHLVPHGVSVAEGNRLHFYDEASALRFLEQFRYDPLAMQRLRDFYQQLSPIGRIKAALDDNTLLQQLAQRLSKSGMSAFELENESQRTWQAGAMSSSTLLTPVEPQPRPITLEESRRWAEAFETEPVPEQKYKIVVEVAGKNLAPLLGWLDLRRTPDGEDGAHKLSFHQLSQSKGGSDAHRVVLSCDEVPNQARTLFYVIGNCHLPLCPDIAPVVREAEAQQWGNVLTPLIPVCHQEASGQDYVNNKSAANANSTTSQSFTPLPPGWLYVYLNGYLWRELQVSQSDGLLSDVNLAGQASKHPRRAEGPPSQVLLVPHQLNGVTQTVQLAFSHQQWNWSQMLQAGGVKPGDPRFPKPIKASGSNTPVDTTSTGVQLTALDLSSYDLGFQEAIDAQGYRLNPVATAPAIMQQAHSNQPTMDQLARYRHLNIPVVALDIAPRDNWVELQFEPGHCYTIQDAEQGGFKQSGQLDNTGFVRVKLPPEITQIDFWIETDANTRPWYFDVPLQVAGGIRDAGQEILHATFELSAWLEDNVPLGVLLIGEDAPNGIMGYVFPWEEGYEDVKRQWQAQGTVIKLPEVAKPETTAGTITNDISQFLAGFIPAMRAVKFIKPASKTGAIVKGMTVGAVVDATVFDPHEARLSDLLDTYPTLRNPVTDYLKSDPTDSNAEGRFKLAIEGLILGAVADQFIRALKAIKYARIKQFVQRAWVRERYEFELQGEKVSDVPDKQLNTYGDYLRDVLGPGRTSHPDEYASILDAAKQRGVDIVDRPGTLAYEPALSQGNPGRLLLDPDASIGAMRHEFRHLLDDQESGYQGFRLMMDSDEFWKLEFRGYMEEINLARELREFDTGRKILQEMRDRRQEILGR